MLRIPKQWFRNFYKKFISLKGDPAHIAAGLAIGVFVGATPTIPLHTAIIVIIGLVFRQNITAGYLGSWLISNPLTIPVLYVSQYELGRILLGMDRCRFALPDFSVDAVAALGWDVLLPLQVGGILMAAVFAVPSYFLARCLIESIRKGRHH
ncbi:MAG: DUF2062 domain-containing protein [Deltaproteobacteria bacterium]|nr:DUF2062 domain-containing protein [Deltaproteobacteria bacterium]